MNWTLFFQIFLLMLAVFIFIHALITHYFDSKTCNELMQTKKRLASVSKNQQN